jgi:hypothetical protein
MANRGAVGALIIRCSFRLLARRRAKDRLVMRPVDHAVDHFCRRARGRDGSASPGSDRTQSPIPTGRTEIVPGRAPAHACPTQPIVSLRQARTWTSGSVHRPQAVDKVVPPGAGRACAVVPATRFEAIASRVAGDPVRRPRTSRDCHGVCSRRASRLRRRDVGGLPRGRQAGSQRTTSAHVRAEGWFGRTAQRRRTPDHRR